MPSCPNVEPPLIVVMMLYDAEPAEAASSRSKPSLPSGSHSTLLVTEEQPLTVAAAAEKQVDSGQQKSTEDSDLSPTKATASRPKLDEEPVIKLTPEHGRWLNDVTFLLSHYLWYGVLND